MRRDRASTLVTLAVARKDAGVERTGMCLQRASVSKVEALSDTDLKQLPAVIQHAVNLPGLVVGDLSGSSFYSLL